MTFQPPFTLEVPLDENITFSEKQEQFLEQLTNEYRKAAKKVNEKERGFYPQELEILNDQRFFTLGDPQNYRSVFRKVFPFGAIAAGATLVIAHNIVAFTEMTRVYATCITNVIDYRPIPYVSVVNVNQQIGLVVTAANINILNGAGAPPITSGICVLEFLKT
jgi:hypothetical protein